ncbi:MAG TPA: hypothetical protein VIL85_25525 [Thermomicrobiales bacterium]|jgi:hypothetical protein
MSHSLVLWFGCSAVVLVGILFLNWRSLRRIQHATDAESLHLAERFRVLSHYAKLRDGRSYDPARYPEANYPSEPSPQRRG